MLNFLNSTVLVAAAAALIPLIIHLFFKRKVKIVEFSSLKHLKTMQRRQVRRLKIRQWLLLLTRMLIVLLVVLAFARPTTESGSIGSHASVSAVILMDNSASMDRAVTDGNLFNLAKKRVGELVLTFTEADEVSFVPLASGSQTRQLPLFSTAAIAAEQLGHLDNRYTAAAFDGALDYTADLLERALNLNKELYFVTDLQRTSLPDTSLPGDLAAVSYLVDLALETIDNCGITGVDFGRQLIVPGHDFTITARVNNYGADRREDLIASLYLDGSRVAQTDFTVTGGEETSVRFVRSLSYTGFHSGYVEISDDKFPGDNRYYFSFRIPDRFNLLIIDGDGTGELLSLALAPSPSINQYWSVKETTPNNLAGVDLWDYDVVFLAGAPLLGNTYWQRLKTFVSQGRSLFVTYGPNTDTAYFNSVWSPVTGVVYDRPAPRQFSRAGYYALYSFDVNHPIFSVFSLNDGALPGIKFYALPTTRLGETARTLLRFTGESPALVEATYGSGRVLTFTAPLDARYSDISGHAFFVPFISRIAEYLAADLSSFDLHLFCGQQISRAVSLKSSITSSMYLVAPDSSQYALVPQEQQGATVLKIFPADLPGIYSITYLGREIDRFALNIDPSECDLTAVNADQFASAVGADDIKRLNSETDMASVIAEYRYGKELWRLFLWLAAVLLAVEVLLSRGSPREQA